MTPGDSKCPMVPCVAGDDAPGAPTVAATTSRSDVHDAMVRSQCLAAQGGLLGGFFFWRWSLTMGDRGIFFE